MSTCALRNVESGRYRPVKVLWFRGYGWEAGFSDGM